MNNYGTGSMLKTVRELLDASSLPEEARRKVLIEYAIGQAEAVLTQEREAGRDPHPRSWEAVRVARAVLSGEAERVGAAAVAIHAARVTLTIAALDDENRAAYPAAIAAYDVGMAALGTSDFVVRDAVQSLLGVSHYAYSANIRERGWHVARAAECATMDRHESSLRDLLVAA